MSFFTIRGPRVLQMLVYSEVDAVLCPELLGRLLVEWLDRASPLLTSSGDIS
jgi:hypothetical protein